MSVLACSKGEAAKESRKKGRVRTFQRAPNAGTERARRERGIPKPSCPSNFLDVALLLSHLREKGLDCNKMGFTQKSYVVL